MKGTLLALLTACAIAVTLWAGGCTTTNDQRGPGTTPTPALSPTYSPMATVSPMISPTHSPGVSPSPTRTP
ncbi:MAG TPA: hypothetical protein VNQ79_04295 [Blastocatellia bacterium]|nr:hypothetical protein [Blastocatellia bacterium]